MNWLWNIRRVDPQQGSPKWVPTLGELQKTLQKGEHLPLRPLPMFESNFVQVTNGGSPVYVHHGANRLILGVAASLPGLVLPDILLIARPPEGRDGPNVVLTRMIPLNLARLYVHDLAAWRLKLRLVTGRYYYLELDAPDSEAAFLFNRWIRLIDLLQEPSNSWVPRTENAPPLGLASTQAPASTWRLQGPPHTRRSAMIVQPTFPYGMLTKKQKKAKALKRRFKSQAVGDSEPLIWSKLEQADAQETPPKRCHPDLHKSQPPVSEKPSITIRTIFSIISNSISSSPSSAKACSSDSDGAALRGLLGPVTRCVRPDTWSASPLGSYEHLERRLWQQDIQDLMDPESSTPSSSSLGPAPCAPAPRRAAPCPLRRPQEQGRPSAAAQRRPKQPPPQKAPLAPACSRKAPFLLDRSHKIPAVRAPSRKVSSGAPRKAPGPPQKVPAPAGPSQKGPQAAATPRKAPSTPAPARKTRPVSPKGPGRRTPSQKAPPAPAAPPKAASPPARHRKSQFPPAPPQRAAGGAAARPVAWDPVEGVLLPSGAGEDLPEPRAAEAQPEPPARVGTQETEVVEVRAQQTSRQLPHGTTKVDSVKVVVSRAHELALGGWTGKGKLQDVTLRKTEETVLDAQGLRTTRLGQQHKWVRTRELAAGGPVQAQSRPFSAEGLALAKLMILANSAEAARRPPPGALPSWLTLPLAPSLDVKDPPPGRPSGAAEGPLHAGPGAKGSPPAPAEAEDRPGGPQRAAAEDRPGAPQRSAPEAEDRPGGPRVTEAEAADDTPGAPRKPTAEAFPSKLASSNPKTGVAEAPTPLPALRWDDMVSPFPAVLSPTPQMETRMSPQHKGAPPESEGAQNQRPLATVGSTSEILLPTLLDIRDVGDDTGQVEELDIFSPRPPGRRVLGLREAGAERPGAAASGGD